MKKRNEIVKQTINERVKSMISHIHRVNEALSPPENRIEPRKLKFKPSSIIVNITTPLPREQEFIPTRHQIAFRSHRGLGPIEVNVASNPESIIGRQRNVSIVYGGGPNENKTTGGMKASDALKSLNGTLGNTTTGTNNNQTINGSSTNSSSSNEASSEASQDSSTPSETETPVPVPEAPKVKPPPKAVQADMNQVFDELDAAKDAMVKERFQSAEDANVDLEKVGDAEIALETGQLADAISQARHDSESAFEESKKLAESKYKTFGQRANLVFKRLQESADQEFQAGLQQLYLAQQAVKEKSDWLVKDSHLTGQLDLEASIAEARAKRKEEMEKQHEDMLKGYRDRLQKAQDEILSLTKSLDDQGDKVKRLKEERQNIEKITAEAKHAFTEQEKNAKASLRKRLAEIKAQLTDTESKLRNFTGMAENAATETGRLVRAAFERFAEEQKARVTLESETQLAQALSNPVSLASLTAFPMSSLFGAGAGGVSPGMTGTTLGSQAMGMSNVNFGLKADAVVKAAKLKEQNDKKADQQNIASGWQQQLKQPFRLPGMQVPGLSSFLQFRENRPTGNQKPLQPHHGMDHQKPLQPHHGMDHQKPLQPRGMEQHRPKKPTLKPTSSNPSTTPSTTKKKTLSGGEGEGKRSSIQSTKLLPDLLPLVLENTHVTAKKNASLQKELVAAQEKAAKEAIARATESSSAVNTALHNATTAIKELLLRRKALGQSMAEANLAQRRYELHVEEAQAAHAKAQQLIANYQATNSQWEKQKKLLENAIAGADLQKEEQLQKTSEELYAAMSEQQRLKLKIHEDEKWTQKLATQEKVAEKQFPSNLKREVKKTGMLMNSAFQRRLHVMKSAAERAFKTVRKMVKVGMKRLHMGRETNLRVAKELRTRALADAKKGYEIDIRNANAKKKMEGSHIDSVERESKLEKKQIARRRKIYDEEEAVARKENALELANMHRDLNETRAEVKADRAKLTTTINALQQAQTDAQHYRQELAKDPTGAQSGNITRLFEEALALQKSLSQEALEWNKILSAARKRFVKQEKKVKEKEAELLKHRGDLAHKHAEALLGEVKSEVQKMKERLAKVIGAADDRWRNAHAALGRLELMSKSSGKGALDALIGEQGLALIGQDSPTAQATSAGGQVIGSKSQSVLQSVLASRYGADPLDKTAQAISREHRQTIRRAKDRKFQEKQQLEDTYEIQIGAGGQITPWNGANTFSLSNWNAVLRPRIQNYLGGYYGGAGTSSERGVKGTGVGVSSTDMAEDHMRCVERCQEMKQSQTFSSYARSLSLPESLMGKDDKSICRARCKEVVDYLDTDLPLTLGSYNSPVTAGNFVSGYNQRCFTRCNTGFTTFLAGQGIATTNGLGTNPLCIPVCEGVDAMIVDTLADDAQIQCLQATGGSPRCNEWLTMARGDMFYDVESSWEQAGLRDALQYAYSDMASVDSEVNIDAQDVVKPGVMDVGVNTQLGIGPVVKQILESAGKQDPAIQKLLGSLTARDPQYLSSDANVIQAESLRQCHANCAMMVRTNKATGSEGKIDAQQEALRLAACHRTCDMADPGTARYAASAGGLNPSKAEYTKSQELGMMGIGRQINPYVGGFGTMYGGGLNSYGNLYGGANFGGTLPGMMMPFGPPGGGFYSQGGGLYNRGNYDVQNNGRTSAAADVGSLVKSTMVGEVSSKKGSSEKTLKKNIDNDVDEYELDADYEDDRADEREEFYGNSYRTGVQGGAAPAFDIKNPFGFVPRGPTGEGVAV
eukprot:g3359.t1